MWLMMFMTPIKEKGLEAAVLKLGFEVGMVASGAVAGAALVKAFQLVKAVPKIVKGVYCP